MQNDYIDVYRQVGDFMSVQTCFPDAFDTAARTLSDRITAHGAGDPWVRAWLAGQDIVFADCSGSTDLPPLDPQAPEWLKRDRAYQAAAVALYRRDFTKAQAQFDAIAADAASPWQKMAPYLAARAAVTAALPTRDPALYANARDRLIALAPPTAYGHVGLGPLAGALDFRDRADARRRELAQMLTAPILPANVAADFKDSRRLGQSPPGDPAYLDWLAVFGREPDQTETAWFEHFAADQVWKTDADALDHARARDGPRTKDPAWLLAALARIRSPDRGAVDGSDRGSESRAGRQSRRPDRAVSSRPAGPRPPIPQRRGPTSTPPWRGRPVVVVTQPAAGGADAGGPRSAELARLAPRTSPCVTEDDSEQGLRWRQRSAWRGCPYSPNRPDMFVSAMRRWRSSTACPCRRASAWPRTTTLPPPLRLDVALTSWTRAVLMQDMPAALRLTATLQPLLPQLDAEWKTLLAAKTPEDKRFAAWFILAKMPGMDVDLGGTYTRPQGKVSRVRWSLARLALCAASRPRRCATAGQGRR